MKSGTYALSLNEFALEVDLDIELSVQYTRAFSHHGPDFVFAVAELWMNVRDGHYLIYPKSNPGNFLEDISNIATAISNPPSVKNLESIIDCGNWCSWMSAYWDRLSEDSLSDDDEIIYEKLIHLSILESKIGHLTIYKYGDFSIIEAATRSDDSRDRVTAWAPFESKFLRETIDVMARDMEKSIRQAL